MKKRKMILTLSVATAACVPIIFGTNTVCASANSAQSYFRGVDAAGAMMLDKESPIVVEKELLTLDLQSFPFSYYESKEEFLSYDGKVTAQYTFFNPSEYTITAKLLFPFGKLPHYYLQNNFEGEENYLSPVDISKYAITVDGERIETTIRHTFSYEYEQFEVQKDLGRIHDGFMENEFYSPDLPVTKYVYFVSGVDRNKYPASTVAIDIPEGDGKTVFWFPKESGSHLVNGDTMRIDSFVTNGEEIELFILGQSPSRPIAWKFYQNGGVHDGEEIAGSMTLVNTESLLFKDLIMDGWNETCGVLEHDWYNATFTQISDGQKNSDFPIISLSWYGKNLWESLLRWYEYEITFLPGQRVENVVTAPLYPDIDLDWKPSIFGYTYLLSPAKTWKGFGGIEIVVNTPYFMTACEIEGFQRTEKGYALALEGLPDGELKFTLSSKEDPKAPAWRQGGLPFFPYGLIIIAILSLAAAGIAVAIVLIRRKKRR